MAIVLVAKEKKKRKLRWINIVIAMIPFVTGSLFIFLAEMSTDFSGPSSVYEKPDIQVNFAVMDSSEVKNLVPFTGVKTEFNYVATDSSGKQVTGKISSVDVDTARKTLERTGLKISVIEANVPGRSDPFVPY